MGKTASSRFRIVFAISLMASLCCQFNSHLAYADEFTANISIKIKAFGDHPESLELSGALNQQHDTLTDGFLQLKVPVTFSISDPKSINLILGTKYPENSGYEIGLSLRPRHIRKEQFVPLPSVTNNFSFMEASTSKLRKVIEQNCQRNSRSPTENLKIFAICKSTFKFLETKNKDETHSGLKAFKGMFDAYVNLVIGHDSIFARDSWIEERAVQLDDRAKSSRSVRQRFRDIRNRLGYFTQMVNEIKKNEVAVYNELRDYIGQLKEANLTQSELKKQQAIVKSELGYLKEQIQSSGGSSLNGITINHLNSLGASISGLASR